MLAFSLTHFQVGDGAVSWKYYGVDLHVLERV